MAEGDGSSAEDRAIDALTKILESAVSTETLQAQHMILRRLALSGDLFPSRIPPPLNITEVGGYLNLLEEVPEVRSQALASALGVAGPNPSPGWDPELPGLYFTTRANDRPAGDAQAAIPVEFTVRSDFARPLDAALGALHAKGAGLPVLRTTLPLPRAEPLSATTPPADLLPYVGRILDLVPAAALADPTADALALGRPSAGGPLQLVARQLDASAPDAASVTPTEWKLLKCDATSCTEVTVLDAFVPLTPVLNAAGWYQPAITAPTSNHDANGWNRWRNLTGLVAGETRLGDELSLLYPAGQIARSTLRGQEDRVWDGTTFAAPAP